MMNSNDTFLSRRDDNERTVIRPMPGGKRSDIPIARQRRITISEPIEPIIIAEIGQINPLEGTLSRLLVLLAQLKHTHSHPSPNTLRSKIIHDIRRFQGATQEAGIDMPTVATARYVMCAVLDEAIINTPWGQECNRANQSLLRSFHQEVCGGERFFALLASLVIRDYDQPNQETSNAQISGFRIGENRIIDGSMVPVRQIHTPINNTNSGHKKAFPESGITPNKTHCKSFMWECSGAKLRDIKLCDCSNKRRRTPKMSMTKKNQRLNALILLIFCTSLMNSVASANDNASETMVTESEDTIRDQQQTIEAILDENRRLRAVIEEMQRVLSGLTDTDQAVETPKVEIETEVTDDDLATKSGLIESPAYARDFDEADPAWRFSVTPRTALRFLTFHDYSSDPRFRINQEEPQFWTNGLTFSVTTPWLPNTSFLITGLYGQEDGKQVVFASQDSVNAAVFESDYDSEIYDFEVLARTAIADSNANWLAGIQYFKLNTYADIPTPLGFRETTHFTSELLLAKVGMGGFFNISDSGFHRIFSNIILGGGVNQIDSDVVSDDTLGTVVTDLNIGYEWVINPTFSLSARYRGQAVYSFGGSNDVSINEKFTVLHGPELHFTTRF